MRPRDVCGDRPGENESGGGKVNVNGMGECDNEWGR